MSPLSPYRAVLRTPYACGAFAASLVGRLCYGIVSLSLILTLTAGGHDYGFAGLVMALFGVAIVLVSPFRAWMVDRHGPRRALPPMAAGFAAVLVAIAVIPARAGVNDAPLVKALLFLLYEDIFRGAMFGPKDKDNVNLWLEILTAAAQAETAEFYE